MEKISQQSTRNNSRGYVQLVYWFSFFCLCQFSVFQFISLLTCFLKILLSSTLMPQSFISIYISQVSSPIKEFTRNITYSYVSTFIIIQTFESKLKKFQGILKTIMLALWLFIKWFYPLDKEVKLIRHSMLYFKVF